MAVKPKNHMVTLAENNKRQEKNVGSTTQKTVALPPLPAQKRMTAANSASAANIAGEANASPAAAEKAAYYSRPQLGTFTEKLYNTAKKAETGLQEKYDRCSSALNELNDAQAGMENWYKHVELIKENYQRIGNPQMGEYLQHAQEMMQGYVDTYNEKKSAYESAYTDYEYSNRRYGQAVSSYNHYIQNQQAQLEAWKGTIRDTGTIQADMDAMDSQIQELEGEIGRLKTLTRGRNDQLGQHMRQSLAQSQAELEQLQQGRAMLQEEYDWSQYFRYSDLKNAADFQKNSRYVSTANGQDPVLNALRGTYTETGFNDLTYDFINRNQEARSKAKVNSIGDNTAMLGLDTSYLEKMTDEEIATFNYLYATQGADAAYQYTAYLTSDLTARQRMDQEAYWSAWAKEQPVKASAFSTLISPLRTLGFIGQSADYMSDGTVDQNAAYNKFSHTKNSIVSEVAQNIEESGKWGKAGSYTYQLGMSMLDSLMTRMVTGNNPFLVRAIMGTSAAADATIAAKDRGLTDDQAYILGTVAGIAEAAIESMNVEEVFSPDMILDGIGKYLLKTAGAEGLEEGLTDIVNIFADILISKDQSEWQKSIDAYIQDGKTQNQATWQALLDQALAIGLDIFGGALSGGIMSGANAFQYNRYTNQQAKALGNLNLDQQDIQSFIETGLESDKETAAYKLASEMKAKLDAGEQLSNQDIARMYQANTQAVEAENAADKNVGTTAEAAEEPERLRLRAVDDDTENAPTVTAEAQSVIENSQNVTQNGQNVAAAQPAPLSVAAQIRQNQMINGGNQNGTQQQLAGPAAAQLAGTAGNRGAGLLYGSGQRYDGTGTPEQTGSVAGRAGSAAQSQALINQRRTTVDRQNRIRSLRLPKVSSKELGLPSGTETQNIQVVPKEHYDTEMEQLSQRVYQETGKDVTFVMGRIQIRGTDGNVRNVNGVMYDDRIIVRADHLRLSMEQIADHEAYHGRVDYFGDSLNQEIRRHIVETYSEEEFRAVLGKYVEALRGVYDVGDIQSGEDYERMLQQIQEEVFADAYAGINAFGAGADRFTSAVNEKMEQLGTGRFRNQDNGVRETNGPPADVSWQKENTAGYGGERFSINERFEGQIDRWDGKTIGFSFVVGETSDALQEAGIPKKQIRWDSSKIKTLLAKHNGMTLVTVKQIPELLEHPIIVIDSKKGSNSKIVMGDLYDGNGKIVTVVLLLTPTSKKGNVLDILKISSAEGRSHIKSLFTAEDGTHVPVRYVDKKRIQSWLNVNRLQLPLHNLDLDSNKIIEDPKVIVKSKTAESEYLSDEEFRERYGLKLRAVDDVENSADSQTFGESQNRKKPRESFSVEDTDREYMAAVEQGDMETAQQMVEEAAKDAGYDTPILYHGTQSFGFTEFDLSKMDDKRTIFLTDNERIAASYSGVMGKRDASGRSSKAVEQLTLQELVEELNSEQYGVGADEDDQFRYSYLSLNDINEMISSVNDRVESLQAEVSQKIREYADKMAVDFDEKYMKIHSNLVKLGDQLNGYQYDKLSSTLYMFLHHTDVFNDSVETAERIASLERDIRLMNKLQYRDNSDGVIVESWLNGYSLTALDDQMARDKLELKRKTGNYGLYAKLQNPLEIDAKGTNWNDIRNWFSSIDINTDNTRVEQRGEDYLLIDNKSGEEIAEGRFGVNAYTSAMPADQLHNYMINKAQSALSIITENMNTTREIAAFAQKRGYDGVIFRNLRDNGGRNAFIGVDELADIYTLFNPNHVKSADPVTYDGYGSVIPLSERFNSTKSDIRYSVDDDAAGSEYQYNKWEQKQSNIEKARQRRRGNAAARKAARDNTPQPETERPATLAKKNLRGTVFDLFSVPGSARGELASMIDNYADRLLKNGVLTEADRKHFFDRMYESGVITVQRDDYFSEGRNLLRGGRVYVPDSVRRDFGDDWGDIRRRAFGSGIYFTSDRSAGGIDSWNHELAEMLPGLFDSEETDLRSILERIVEVAEEGRDEKMSLPEYTARLAEQEHTSEAELLYAMERKLDEALRTFAENAKLEVQLKKQSDWKLAKERAVHREMAQRQKDRKELRELQQKTLKTLQWLNKNRNRAPEELKEAFDEVLGDIDLYAVGAANEMQWSDRYNATWKDLAQMYKDASKSDPNFLPSKELEKIVGRLDGTKIAEMDLGALNDLYKAAVGLRTEFYNRNNVIDDEMDRLFEEVYTDAKKEINAAPGGYTGKKLDKFVNMDQLTPMNVLQRMGGWDPNGTFYSMAKQLEKGERDMRAYSVNAQKMLQDFLTEHQDWVKKADGQGKDGIWYEVEIPELIALELGKKPKFGATIKVSMTPAQKVHMYLESKNVDNLRHMTGGRTFADKKLYSEGKRQEALAQGRTIRMAPETVKAIVSDLTAEEMELAQLLEQYYNSFATKEINRVSNILYGYDKAMGKNYAPIYTNRNYTKTEFGIFDQTAEGVGNLKGRQYSVNPSYNISAFDAFERHVDQTARFVGMAIPARNWTTLMNWREQKNSTGDVITHKWGEEGKRYITDLINTLQAGDDVKSDTVSTLASKLQSTYITAIFGANPSIVLKQLGSIPLASAYLDARNIPTPQQIKNIDRELIGKYTQDLEWRTMGYSMPETRQLKENPNWTQTNKFYNFTFGGGAITAMDGWAASVLWPWAENKVRRDFPDLVVGSQEQINKGESPYYKKVAEVFEDALSRSQSTSDEIHQSSLRKSKNPITKAFTMFRSDSAQTYNALRQKIGEAQYYIRTGADEQIKEAAKRTVGAAIISLLMNSMWSEAVNFLMALWKNKGKYYRDEDDELTVQSVAGEMVSGMVGSFGGIVTGGEELLEVIGNLLTGEKIYDIETPGIEQLNDFISAVTDAGGNFRDVIAGAVNVAVNGGDLGDYFGKRSNEILGSIKELAETTVMYLPGLAVSGFPVSNLEAYLLGAVKWLSPKLATAYEDLFQSVRKNDLNGLEGNALTSRIKRIMKDRQVTASADTVGTLAELYESGYKSAMISDTPSSVTIDGEKQALNSYQQQQYEINWSEVVSSALDDIVTSEAFKGLDQEQQAKMLGKLYDYASEIAKESVFDSYELSESVEENQKIVDAGASLADCIIWNTVSSDLKSGEKSEMLLDLDIPESAKRAIFQYKITDSRDDSIDAFRQAGMNFDDFLSVYAAYGKINNMDIRASEKATEFSYWLDNQGYSEAQKNIVKDELVFFSMTPANAGKYEKLVASGMDPQEAYELADALDDLEPREGEDKVDNVQQWRECVKFSDNVAIQLAALRGVADDKQYAKIQMAYDYGVNPDSYVGLQEIKSQHDADGNGSFTNDEMKAAVDSLPGLSTEQKAVLWQLATGNTSAKNNPYSREVGQKIVDARAAAKEGSK